MEIVNTGALERINHERTEDVEVVNIFKGIYGVGEFGSLKVHCSCVTVKLSGPHIAYKWFASGCRTLEDVKQRKGGIVVSDVQEVCT